MNRLLVILAISASLLGCGSVREARRAQAPNNIPAGERTVSAAEIGLTANTALTIDKAVDIALHYHPSIVQSRERLNAARARFSSARGSYLPQVDARISNSTSKSEDSASRDSNSASISLSELIYDFGKTPATVRQSYQNLLAAEATNNSTISNTTYKVKAAYYDLIKQTSLVKVSEESVRQFEKRLEQVKGFAEVGRRIKYDVTKTEVDLADARLKLIKALNGLKVSRASLNNALGLAEDPGYTIESLAPPAEVAYQLDALWTKVRERNPDLLSQIADERAASAAVDKAISDLYPSISADGSYSYSGSDFPLAWNWAFGLGLRLNIFQGFQKINQISEAISNLRIARAERAAVEQQLYLELNRAFAQLEDSKQQMAITSFSIKQAEENLILVQYRYEVGKASSVELTDAQVSLANARYSQVQSEFDYRIASALIQKTIYEVEP